MSYTYQELKHTKMGDLRKIAEGLDHEAVRGYTQLNKNQLLLALCGALGIDTHEHHQVVGVDKRAIKTQIRELKVKRDAAANGVAPKELKQIRREIHKLKRALHKATV